MMPTDPKKGGGRRTPEPKKGKDPGDPDMLEKPDDPEVRKKDAMKRRHGIPPQTTG